MEVLAALRRIKRQFGDEYNVVITDQDIFDWIYDAELDIIRSNSDNDSSLQVVANKFPIYVPDKVSVKRVSVNGRALTYTTVTELDFSSVSVDSKGGLRYWYMSEGNLHLYPVSEITDITSVEITYSKTPTAMSVVAPFLNFSNYSTPTQYASVPSDDDWKNTTSVNIAVQMSVGMPGQTLLVAASNNGNLATDQHFSVQYVDTTLPQIIFTVSDGATSKSAILPFLAVIKKDEVFKFRVTYTPATGTSTLYRIDTTTEIETIQSTDVKGIAFNKQMTAGAKLFFGVTNDTTPVIAHPAMKIYDVELWGTVTTQNSVFKFNGESDLGTLPIVTSTFNTLSSHTVTTVGNVVTTSGNQFTVPEVYHEDIVKYCLARAHSKNQNFRAAEAEMEQYDRRVSTRRNEAQAPDTALYKIPDPSDYDEYMSY